MTIPFVHLHVHSDFSLLDGTASCGGMAKLVKEYGMTACALTDHGNMSGCWEFIQKMTEVGAKPILGCEFYVAPGSYLDKESTVRHQKGFHLVCLAENYRGYQNLCHLNEEAWTRGHYYHPRIDKNLLREYHEGIICLSACISGEIPRLFLENNPRGAEAAVEEYADIFGENNFFIELQRHGIPEEDSASAFLIDVARRKGLPLVVTNDSHYLLAEHAEAHELFLCIGTQKTMNDPTRMRFQGSGYYFKSPEEMAALFPELPEAMANTVMIAERCDVHLPTVNDKPPLVKANHYPAYPMESPEKNNDDCREAYLRQLCAEALPSHYGFSLDQPEDTLTERQREVVQRMNYEIGIIRKTGFISYFLVVWDFLNYGRKAGVPLGPGRGSGAGSIVAYLLHITNIDPLEYGLLFERFLNPERVSPPDFDIDLCERRRQKVIEYVRQKYGAPNVTQIGTFGTLKARAVVKDVGRVLSIPIDDVSRLNALIPAGDPKMTLKKAYDGSEKLRELVDSTPEYRELWKYANVLEGLNRNMSIHAAGVIICDVPVADVVPISKGAGDEATTQFSAVPCETLGLLKMDFLGLRTLTIIQDTLDLIESVRGIHLESDDIPLDDANTYALLNRGATVAVFQLESTGMQDLCRRFGVENIKHIIALIALYRPGPMQYMQDFIDRKNGRAVVEYATPEMKPILEETFGIMLYQEQIMQVAQAVAGFTLGQADILRRAIGKKKEYLINEMFDKFLVGGKALGHDEETLRKIYDDIKIFAGYGFNKSHSAAYGILSYRTAFLKANYAPEYMASVLTSELGNSEKMAFFLKECRNMGIPIMPPDVNVCDVGFSVADGKIFFGLAAIHGVGEQAVSGIIAARKKDGPFKDLEDFCERVDGLNRRLMENLIRAGALDCFGLKRSQLLAIAENALAAGSARAKDRRVGQGSLFDLLEPEEKKMVVPNVPELPLKELLASEKELLGFYVSGHPIAEYQKEIDDYQSDDLSSLSALEENRTVVRTGAYLAGVQIKQSKKGQTFAILQIENREVRLECLLFGDTFRKVQEEYPDVLRVGNTVLIEGEVNREETDTQGGGDDASAGADGAETPVVRIKLMGRRVVPIELAQQEYAREIHLRLHEDETTQEKLTQIRQIISESPGNTPVLFTLVCRNGNIIYVQDKRISVQNTAQFRERMYACINRDDAILVKPNHHRPEPIRRAWRPRGA